VLTESASGFVTPETVQRPMSVVCRAVTPGNWNVLKMYGLATVVSTAVSSHLCHLANRLDLTNLVQVILLSGFSFIKR